MPLSTPSITVLRLICATIIWACVLVVNWPCEAIAQELEPIPGGDAVGTRLSDSPAEIPIFENSERAPVWRQSETSSLVPIGVKVGYDNAFVIASSQESDLNFSNEPFQLKINGWGQLRHTVFQSGNAQPDSNQFQLKRGRVILSGTAFTNDFTYFVQFDGRSTSGDQIRLLDYYLSYDVGHAQWGKERGTIGFKSGRFKMPYHLARSLSGREFQFADRSVASTFFDVNRSLAWGLYGRIDRGPTPVYWESAIFNGLVTGGAETGSSGSLDSNFAYSGRVFAYPIGDWGRSELTDLECHSRLAMRVGAGFANSTIDRIGSTEFSSVRVVDSGAQLSSLLSGNVDQYTVNLYSVDTSFKFRGWSSTFEYYFRTTDAFRGDPQPDLFDHGFWLQAGKFIVPGRLELLARWSRVSGNSGTLGMEDQSSDELAAGMVFYARQQNAKLTVDATYLDGAPINSPSLDIVPGDLGWLFRSQLQFAF